MPQTCSARSSCWTDSSDGPTPTSGNETGSSWSACWNFWARRELGLLLRGALQRQQDAPGGLTQVQASQKMDRSDSYLATATAGRLRMSAQALRNAIEVLGLTQAEADRARILLAAAQVQDGEVREKILRWNALE